MAVWAFIDESNKATNFVDSNGIPGYIPDGHTAVEIPLGTSYGYGWSWDGMKLVEPVVPNSIIVPESITRRQCAMQLFSVGMITGDEGIAMTQSGIPPIAVQAYLATLPEPDLTMAMMDFAATSYFRDNPLLAALMTANNMTDEQVDQFFIEASKR